MPMERIIQWTVCLNPYLAAKENNWLNKNGSAIKTLA
jgi:hypothetical protein